MFREDTACVSMARHSPEPLAVRPFLPEDGALRAQGLPNEVRVPFRIQVSVSQVDLVERDPCIWRRRCDPHDSIFPSLSSRSEPYRQAFGAVHDDGTQHYKSSAEFDPFAAVQQLGITMRGQIGSVRLFITMGSQLFDHFPSVLFNCGAAPVKQTSPYIPSHCGLFSRA
jgi:hypothetical protein